jgi:hypothetical protein
VTPLCDLVGRNDLVNVGIHPDWDEDKVSRGSACIFCLLRLSGLLCNHDPRTQIRDILVDAGVEVCFVTSRSIESVLKAAQCAASYQASLMLKARGEVGRLTCGIAAGWALQDVSRRSY